MSPILSKTLASERSAPLVPVTFSSDRDGLNSGTFHSFLPRAWRNGYPLSCHCWLRRGYRHAVTKIWVPFQTKGSEELLALRFWILVPNKEPGSVKDLGPLSLSMDDSDVGWLTWCERGEIAPLFERYWTPCGEIQTWTQQGRIENGWRHLSAQIRGWRTCVGRELVSFFIGRDFSVLSASVEWPILRKGKRLAEQNKRRRRTKD